MPTAPTTKRTPPTPSTRPRPRDLVRRGGAVVVLLTLLVGIPVGAAMVTGSLVPRWSLLQSAWTTGRIDDDAVVQIGLGLFALLWAWFSLTAVAEAVHVVRAHRRSGGRATLPPVTASPSGAVRKLVRLALISSTALIGSGLAPLVLRGAGEARASANATLRPIARIEVNVEAHTRTTEWRSTTVDHQIVAARQRDTPYSIAARLGDTTMRDRIIEMNRGEWAPDGTRWTGGVFPAGMEVRVPVARVVVAPTTGEWTTYTVRAGDSVYAIAADISTGDQRTVGEVADQIIRRNVGRTMVDGSVFDDPSLVRIGWVLDVPADGTIAAPSATDRPGAMAAIDASQGHVVVVGESYWRIAEDQLESQFGRDADPPAVAAATRDLRDLNAPRLGHDDPNLILPGEVLHWVDATTPAAPAPVSDPAAAEPAATQTPQPAATVTTLPTAAEPTVPAPITTTVPVLSAPNAPAAPAAPAASTPSTPSTPSTVPAVPAVTPPIAERPATTLAPAAISDVADADDGTSIPVPATIGATVLLAAGALGLLEARRREQLRRATVRSRIATPTPDAVRTETALRRLGATDRALRIDVALRAAASRLIVQQRHVVALLLDDTGEILLVLDEPALATAPWEVPTSGPHWRLPASVATIDLADDARRAGPPCPALVHLGRTAVDAGEHDPSSLNDADLFVDLEAIGLLCLDGAASTVAPIAAAIAATIAASPLAETSRSITVGIDGRAALGSMDVDEAESLDAALDLAATQLGSTRSVSGGRRTFALRATAGDGRSESWEPVVIVSAGHEPTDEVARDVVELTEAGGRGLAIVVDRPLPGATWFVRADPVAADGAWVLDPLGLRFTPCGLSTPDLGAIHDLLDQAAQPLPAPVFAPPAPDVPAVTAGGFTAPRPAFAERPWTLVIRVLGGVSVVDADGRAVEFGRSKSLELAAWLGLHRERPTRTSARTALWELDVRAPTFANVVSEARRAMARLVLPPQGEEWVERTLTEQLPLHGLVVTDVDLLRARVEAARDRSPAEAIEVLRPGLELVTDVPFAGTDYLWPDAEGFTSALTLLATGAATELARNHLELGDVEGVFWATGQGLKVLPGHEELIALRMRAYACRGDLAGVRGEWDVYERALHADPWSSAEPSAKLVAVRRELLSR